MDSDPRAQKRMDPTEHWHKHLFLIVQNDIFNRIF
jgi:hypothetical protein